jgi:hypothetical protein
MLALAIAMGTMVLAMIDYALLSPAPPAPRVLTSATPRGTDARSASGTAHRATDAQPSDAGQIGTCIPPFAPPRCSGADARNPLPTSAAAGAPAAALSAPAARI